MERIRDFKRKVHHLLSPSEKVGSASWVIDVFIITLILLNALVIVLESVEPLYHAHHALFHGFDVFSVIVFSIEYILRIWSANVDERYRRPVLGNIRYGLTTIALIDLVAILPFFLPFLGIDLRNIRLLRLLRMFRFIKLIRYSKALGILNNVLREKREELVITIIFMFFLLLICSSLMYYIEHSAQPEVFSSIPQTMWWGISALTTVGYGDMYPITPVGRIFGGLISIIGIGVFALPAGIMASGFSSHLSTKREDEP